MQNQAELVHEDKVTYESTLLNIVDLLKWRAKNQPKLKIYSFLSYKQDKRIEESITSQELDVQSRCIAAFLQKKNAKGERALLLFPYGKEFVEAFYACLYAEVFAIPAYHNVSIRRISKLLTIIKDSGAKYLLTTSEIIRKVKPILEKQETISDIEWVTTDVINNDFVKEYSDPAIVSNQVAYLQYTSGSTSDPKGVIINHQNIMCNLRLMSTAFKYSEKTVGVGWVPHYHDMGLVAYILAPVYLGVQYYLMSPFDFMQKPFRWLEAISDFKGTTGGGPNFCYDLCVNTISEAEKMKLDLSTWESAWNGAEPVRAETLFKFFESFKNQGFIFDSFTPCYGMAETTLGITFNQVGQKVKILDIDCESIENDGIINNAVTNKRQQSFVSNGKEINDVLVRIVDPDTFEECPAYRIGEIWSSSDSLAVGYWEKPDINKEIFAAYISKSDEGPFLRTGDLGFVDESKELYITGRVKDLIIIRGVNYFPNDIELSVQNSHISLNPNSCVAFASVIDGEEKLIIIQEILRTHMRELNENDVFKAIKEAVSEKHEIYPYEILLVQYGSVPKTTSGKIQRSQCKKSYNSEKLKVLHRRIYKYDKTKEYPEFICREELVIYDDRTKLDVIENNLVNGIASLLSVNAKEIPNNKSLVNLGLDSLVLTSLKQSIESNFSITLESKDLFDQETSVIKLSAIILDKLNTGNKNELPEILLSNSDDETPFPLTNLQYAYWIGRGAHFDLGGIGAHLYLEIDCEDKDMAYNHLNYTFNTLIRHHPMLRAIFTEDGQQKFIKETPAYQIKQYNILSNKKVEHLNNIRNELEQQIFKTNQWPLFDIRTTCINNKNTILHLSFDLLIVDIWSVKLIIEEWYKLYSKQITDLQQLNITFKDYVNYTQLIKKTEIYEKSKDYWIGRIKDFPLAPQLPIEKSAKEIDKIQFTHREKIFSKSDWERLNNKANKYGVTLSNMFLAAYSKILSNWSKSPKFVVNLTLFNRLNAHPEINYLVGDFTSVLLLEVYDNPKLSFFEFVQSIQNQLSADLDHKYFSGVDLIREIEKSNQSSSDVLMPVVFTSAITNSIKEKPLQSFGKRSRTISQTPQVWLDNQLYNVGNELIISWDAVEDLFPANMLDDMFAAYTQLIDNIMNSDDIWESRITGLIPEKQLKARKEYNNTQRNYKPELLHGSFEEIAKKSPDNIAIYTENKSISYQQLLVASQNIARLLIENGATTNSVIGINMSKGWEQIAAVLGILSVGGIYISIDSNLPVERKEYLIETNGIKQLLIQTGQKVENENLCKATIVDETAFNDTESNVQISSSQSVEDLAYIIYTSGSTGLPKGVMISHKSAYNTIVDINRKFKLSDNDRIFALSSLSFDLSVYDIFGTLSTGAAMVIPSPGNERNPEHWLSLVQKYGVTLWNSVPALMEMLVEFTEANDSKLNSLRCSLLSGDWIPLNLPDRIKKLSDNSEVISLGGATEGAIWSIYYPVNKVDNQWPSIPYGMPLDNQHFYVLNESLGQCPDYVTGELYIGGDGVATGYWKDKEKTENVFVTHPETGEKLYKTGDLGRFIPDGYIQFLGREDSQVKIGGFRVELGEIETVLNKYEKVQRCAITKVFNKNIGDKLVGYLVLNEKSKVESIVKNKNYDYGLEIKAFKNIPLLKDSEERLLFKLKDFGIRIIEGRKIELEVENDNIEEKYSKRTTSRRFINQKMSLDRFSSFLSCLQQRDFNGLKKYQYASAGGLYPVQIYVSVKKERIVGLKEGNYYYHPSENKLIQISEDIFLNERLHVKANKSVCESSAFTIFLVGDLKAIAPMYGNKARDFCLIEAGLITQLMELRGVENSVGLCQVGALVDEKVVNEAFYLSDSQILLHTILGGMVDYNDPLRGVTKENNGKYLNEIIIHEIKDFLKSKLPSYMVPSQFKIVDKIPLTKVGKVNYKELTAFSEFSQGETCKEPTNENEQKIYDIIAKLTNIKQLDIHKNFFELGIDSLTLVQIWRIIKDEFNFKFPVAKVFENPTISKLTTYLFQENKEDNTAKDIEVRVGQQRAAMKRKMNLNN